MTTFPLWEGKKLIHKAGVSKFTPARCESFIQLYSRQVHPDVLVALKNALLNGPIGLDDVVQKGEFRGTIANRIQAWMKKTYDFAPDPKNTILNDCLTKSLNKDIIYDLYGQWNQTFNWNPGDFGDSGSCFWGCNSSNRYWLMEFKPAYAMQFWRRTDHKFIGYGRCWVFVDWPCKGCMMIFNAYPKGLSLPLYASAILDGLSSVDKKFTEDCVVRTISFTSSHDRWFYTNDGIAQCILTPEALEHKMIIQKHIVLDVPKPTISKFKAFKSMCHFSCNRPVMSDRPHISTYSTNGEKQIHLCEYCLQECYKRQHNCNLCKKRMLVVTGFENAPEVAKLVRDKKFRLNLSVCSKCFENLPEGYETVSPKNIKDINGDNMLRPGVFNVVERQPQDDWEVAAV